MPGHVAMVHVDAGLPWFWIDDALLLETASRTSNGTDACRNLGLVDARPVRLVRDRVYGRCRLSRESPAYTFAQAKVGASSGLEEISLTLCVVEPCPPR